MKSNKALAREMFELLLELAHHRDQKHMAQKMCELYMYKIRKLKKTGKFGRFTVGRTKRKLIEVESYWRKGYTYVFENKRKIGQ